MQHTCSLKEFMGFVAKGYHPSVIARHLANGSLKPLIRGVQQIATVPLRVTQHLKFSQPLKKLDKFITTGVTAITQHFTPQQEQQEERNHAFTFIQAATRSRANNFVAPGVSHKRPKKSTRKPNRRSTKRKSRRKSTNKRMHASRNKPKKTVRRKALASRRQTRRKTTRRTKKRSRRM